MFCLVDATDDVRLLPELVGAGVDGVQVRAKGLADSLVLDLTRTVIDLVRQLGATVIVNDRVDLALAADADGVHLGRSDLPVAAARSIAPDLLIGATCRDRAHVRAAAAAGSDYAGIGPVFASGSKAGLPSPIGVEAVANASGVLPLIAIGGVDATNAAALTAAGAHGAAVIHAIWRQPDPVASARELLTALG